jgi:hypothetical protein
MVAFLFLRFELTSVIRFSCIKIHRKEKKKKKGGGGISIPLFNKDQVVL